MNFILTNTEGKGKAGKSFLRETYRESLGSWGLYCENKEDLICNENVFGIIDGYLKNFEIPPNSTLLHQKDCTTKLWDSWPLPENYTGSFSTTIVDAVSSDVVLCNDVIGLYPLYYFIKGETFIISNSLIWIGAYSETEFDPIGIAQRCLGPEFCNVGRRTILESCKRLLPGEWLKFDSDGKLIENRFDNSLYDSIFDPNDEKNLSIEYWNLFKKEVEFCLNGLEEINIALSGGIDSRILLGAMPNDKRVSCYTYGRKDNYESKVAGRLAKLKGFEHQSFSDPNQHFPDPKTLLKYTRSTESVFLGSWLEILENLPKEERQPFLIGDLSTAISGRTIKKFSSKEYQLKNFIKHNVLNKPYDLKINSGSNFEIWKGNTTSNFLWYYSDTALERLALKVSFEEVRERTQEDLQVLYNRIESHTLPFTELADELFVWYTHTRFPMGKQVLINNKRFNAFCPSMSLAVIRFASRLHPDQRLNQRFVRKLFRNIPDLNLLSKVPTSQIPIIPQNFPSIIRFPVWGFRSKVDNYLIKRLIRAKNPDLRYRLFKSNNWVEVYQNPQMEKNLDEYFQDNYLGESFVSNIKQQAIQRMELKQWPFANMNILNAAALNAELQIIKKYQSE